MIELKEISYSYKRNHPVLQGISMKLVPGNIYGILGKNGVGKSTLLKIICGLLKPQGACFVNGQKPFDRSPLFLQEVCIIPETPFVPDMTIGALATLTAPFYPSFESDLLEKALREFEVPVANKLPRMSLGQQKKALIALAIACNTQFLIMDEPTNGLDIPSKSIFRKLIAGIADEQRTILISTHQVRDLENLINAVIILENEGVLLNSTLAEIEDRLWFGDVDHGQIPLYLENSIRGVRGVTVNTCGEPATVDMEMLFNAVTQNKTKMEEIFADK
ncbi:MAG: ATP-binding cassette domain-containing protein [Bacteroidales bacterium]